MADEVKVGIIGLGTVGEETAKTLINNRELIKEKTGVNVVLKGVADIRIKKMNTRWLKGKVDFITEDAKKIINDPEIDIVVELIGGLHPAKEFIIESLFKGKRVVTANKAVLARFWDEIQEAVRKGNTEIKYEASVGGVIPVIEAIQKSLVADRILKIYGVLNGTTNYILSRMEKTGEDYKKLLKEAQKLGYAEANPASDVSGEDSAYKIFILSLISGKKGKFERVFYEGIERIKPIDFKYAHTLGYTIRLVAYSDISSGKLDIFVKPMLVPLSNPLSFLTENLNMVIVKGEKSGQTVYEGMGAGGEPTSVAVSSNVVSLARDIVAKGKVNKAGQRKLKVLPLKTVKERVFPWYIRFVVKEDVGIIHALSSVLKKYRVSIKAIYQQEVPEALYSKLPFVITVHSASEEIIKKALKEMKKFSFMVEPPFLLPFLVD